MNEIDFSREIWERFTTDPARLGLDLRVDEEPEDYFVRLAQSGRRKDVISALRELIALHVVRQPDTELRIEVQFLSRAFRLCDVLEARECKEPLKLFLLEDNADRWKSHLAALQELAARALLSLPKHKREFRYWSEIAFMARPTCPYALNAVLDIDLARGIECVLQVYEQAPKRLREQLADWPAILWMAKQAHGESRFKKAAAAILGKSTFRAESGPMGVLASLAGISQYSKAMSGLNMIFAPHHGPWQDRYTCYEFGPSNPRFTEESTENRLRSSLEYSGIDQILLPKKDVGLAYA